MIQLRYSITSSVELSQAIETVNESEFIRILTFSNYCIGWLNCPELSAVWSIKIIIILFIRFLIFLYAYSLQFFVKL